jgi:hypothetical protein
MKKLLALFVCAALLAIGGVASADPFEGIALDLAGKAKFKQKRNFDVAIIKYKTETMIASDEWWSPKQSWTLGYELEVKGKYKVFGEKREKFEGRIEGEFDLGVLELTDGEMQTFIESLSSSDLFTSPVDYKHKGDWDKGELKFFFGNGSYGSDLAFLNNVKMARFKFLGTLTLSQTVVTPQGALAPALFAEASASSPVPEPATMLLFGTGLLGLAGLRLRRKK